LKSLDPSFEKSASDSLQLFEYMRLTEMTEPWVCVKTRKDITMKTSSCLSKLSLTLAVFALTLILFSQAQASPTVRLFGGFTSVQLSDDLLGALTTLGITPDTIAPGALSESTVRFPISGGGIDQATLAGDIFHVGGLSLTNADGTTTVELLNFIIDTTGQQPVLTGLVTNNGDLVGRLPLFNLSLANAQVVMAPFNLSIQGVDASLTADAAEALNAVFGVDAFVEGLNIGIAEGFALF
jgi:hypothetical protein